MTAVGLLTRSPNLSQKLFSISLALALRLGLLENAGNIQSDALPFLLAKNVLPFLIHGLRPTRPARGFLFDFQPSLHVIGKKTRPALFGGKMPDFVDLDQRVSLLDGFDQLGLAPGAA